MTPRHTIIKAGLLAGSLDIAAACIQYTLQTGGPAANVPVFVASGVFGKNAFTGGVEMILAGLLFHYLIAGAFAVAFFWIVPKVAFLNRHWILAGVLYGIFVWALMNLVVLPLSNAPPLPLNIKNSIQAALILIGCIGLPLSFIHRKSRMRRAGPPSSGMGF